MNTSIYNQNYYRAHREKLLARKNNRYKIDSVYRALIARNSKLRLRIKKLSNMDKVIHNDKLEVGYSVYTMARLLGFAPTTLVQWRLSGILPATPYKKITVNCKGGPYRLYPASNVYVVDYVRSRINSGDRLTYEYIRDLMTLLWPRTFWSVREVIAYVKKANFIQGKDSRDVGKRKDNSPKADWVKAL